jgi:hypothetical protein
VKKNTNAIYLIKSKAVEVFLTVVLSYLNSKDSDTDGCGRIVVVRKLVVIAA